MYRTFTRVLAVAVTLIAGIATLNAAGPKITDPAKVDSDYALQGEYTGTFEDNGETFKAGAQIIALGNGEFAISFYPGGLPGDGAGRLRGPRRAARRGRGLPGRGRDRSPPRDRTRARAGQRRTAHAKRPRGSGAPGPRRRSELRHVLGLRERRRGRRRPRRARGWERAGAAPVLRSVPRGPRDGGRTLRGAASASGRAAAPGAAGDRPRSRGRSERVRELRQNCAAELRRIARRSCAAARRTELGEVALGVRVLRAEGGAEGVDVAHGAGEGLHLELQQDPNATHLALHPRASKSSAVGLRMDPSRGPRI